MNATDDKGFVLVTNDGARGVGLSWGLFIARIDLLPAGAADLPDAEYTSLLRRLAIRANHEARTALEQPAPEAVS